MKNFSKDPNCSTLISAIGCADFEAPMNTRTVREKNMTEISCGDGQKWVVKCEGSKWVGEYDVCASAMIDGPRYIGVLSVGLSLCVYSAILILKYRFTRYIFFQVYLRLLL